MMINVKEFEITLSESELYIIVFAIRDRLLGTIHHCSQHRGMGTFFTNHKEDADMLEAMCTRLDRVNIYSDFLKDLEDGIKKAKTSAGEYEK